MAGSGNTQQKTFSRILLGAVVLVLAGGMLLYLVPSMPGNGAMRPPMPSPPSAAKRSPPMTYVSGSANTNSAAPARSSK